MNSHQHIVGGILIGGNGRRLGYCAKGLLRIRSQTIIESQIAILRPLCDEIVLLGTSNAYHQMGLKQLEDPKHMQGPLAGIAAGLSYAKEYLLTLPCDLPFMTAGVLKTLLAQRSAKPIAAKDGDHTHPLVACYPIAAAEHVARHAQQGHSVHRAFEEIRGQWVHFNDPAPFENINTSNDYDRAIERAVLLAEHIKHD